MAAVRCTGVVQVDDARSIGHDMGGGEDSNEYASCHRYGSRAMPIREPKRGRYTMRTKKRREHLLRIPLTKGDGSEFEAVERAAEKKHFTPTAWARSVILREAEKVNEGGEG